MKIAGIVIGALILVLALDYSGVLWEGVIMIKREEIRRDVFEGSRAFNEGVIRDLANYRQQWLDTEDETERSTIESTVRHRFPNYAIEDVPSGELRTWFRTVRGY